MGTVPLGVFEVEIAGPENEEWLFPPTQERLRGRYDALNVSHLDPGERLRALHKIAPSIPGLYLRVDTRKKTVAIVDPLRETDEGRRLWDAIKSQVSMIDSSSNIEPWKTRLIELRDSEGCDDTLKNWMHWIARGIGDGICRATSRSDKWPTLSEIKSMPGRRKIDPSNNLLVGDANYEAAPVTA